MKSETKQEYAAECKKYFRNISSTKTFGASADERAFADKFLPSKRKEQQSLDRYEKGFGKASRSGAFSKASTGHAFFPNGLRFASEFIDEHTPKGYKPPPNPFEVVKPIEQTHNKMNLPKPAFMCLDKCMDCMKPIDLTPEGIKDYAPNLGFITETNQAKLLAMGLKFADPFVTMFHASCMDRIKEFRKNTVPLVKGGTLITEKERNLILKYKNQLQIHDGNEMTIGDWLAAKRLEKIAFNTQDFIIEQRKIGNMKAFREDRQ